MSEFPQITEAELKIMQVLWQLSSATSGQVVQELTATTKWKAKTIQTLLTRLVIKGAVETIPLNQKSFLYQPKISQEDYQSQASQHFLDKLYAGSINLMVAHFVEKQQLSKKQIEELRRILDEGDGP